jgi:Ca2+-binding RTX toxin-like protein
MATLVGTDGNDALVGTADADTITGLKGLDTIDGGAGADIIDGGDQADVIHGGDGDDVLDSGYKTSNVYQNPTTRITVFGDGGGNQVFGDAGDDLISGGAADLLDGGDGADTLIAGAGSTAMSQPRSSGRVTLLGGAGDDKISVGGYYATIDGGAGNDIIGISGQLVGGDPDHRHLVTLGAGADTLALVSAASFPIFSTEGEIVVSDFGLDDKLTYGDNGSYIDPFGALGAGGAGKRIGQSGADVILTGGVSGDVILSNVDLADLTAANFDGHAIANVWTFGTTGGDTLTGGAGVDYLDGYKGDDVIIGGGGGDQLGGGLGADVFRYLSATDSMTGGQDTLIDFATGTDRIDLTALAATEISLIRSGAVTFIFAEAASGHFVLGVNGAANIGDLDTGARGVYAIGDGADNTIVGGANGDVIQAGGGDDTITGGGGGDVLFGEAGRDTFKYLTASDSTAANPDAIHGFQTGVDSISFVVGASEISLIRSGGSTFLFANTANGAMQLATVGQDLNARDIYTASSRDYYILGDTGADTLIGNNGNDVIQGGAGDDVIIGAFGGDVLYGQGGADTFKYQSASDSSSAYQAGKVDSIFDFQSGVDKLDLTGVRTGASDQIGIYSTDGSTFVFVDLGGDGVNDMTLQLNGTASITSGDYLF